MRTSQPRASVLMLAYRQAQTVVPAVKSLFAQDVNEPIEILLSDDGSDDDTHARLVAAARRYRGPHQVRVLRNAANLGIAGHYNRLVAEARGELLVTAAGDDVSAPQRLRRLLAAWDDTNCQADLIASDLRAMDEQGSLGASIVVDRLDRWRDVSDWCRQRPYIVGAGHAFTKRLFRRFGSLATDLVNEDQIITLRALMSGGAVTVAEPLVMYRSGGTSFAAVCRNGRDFVAHQQLLYRRRHAELQQMQADAVLGGRANEIQAALGGSWARNEFLGQLLKGDESFWRLALRSDAESPAWRLRKCLYFGAPNVASWVTRIQQLRRGQTAARRDAAPEGLTRNASPLAQPARLGPV